LDDARNAARFVALLNPTVVLWVRYEFWYHHLAALRLARVPTFLVSGIFRKDQPFFRWYGSAWRTMIGAFDHLFVQDEASRALLAGIGSTNVSVSGDTRFDRVAAIAAKQEELPIARAFTGTGNALVCGSSWPEDEVLLLEAFSTMTQVPKCIVAPHELNEQHLLSVEAKFPKPLVRWSELEGTDPANIAAVLGTEQGGTLLVDRMGLLSRLYRYGDAAYVGGGFGDGIHSLLEAAAWGTPVVFGPDHRKFVEATGLIEQGAGFEVKDAASLSSVLDRLFAQPGARKNASESAARYVDERKGATAHVVERIRPVLSGRH
jgi:3-deoxy-D-manno-octulosonic-acid transferase